MASGGEEQAQNFAQSTKISIINSNFHSNEKSINIDEEVTSTSTILQSLLKEAGIKKNYSLNKPISANKVSLLKRPLEAKDTETEPPSEGKVHSLTRLVIFPHIPPILQDQ